VDTTAAVTADAFRACLEQVAADDGVDAVIAVTVPTAIADLRAAITAAVLAKPIAAALLEQGGVRPAAPARDPRPTRSAAGRPERGCQPRCGQQCCGRQRTRRGSRPAARRPGGAAVDGIPAYAYPEGATRALGHAVRYRAWRDRQAAPVPELSGLRIAAARELVAGFLTGSPGGGWLTAGQTAELLSCYQIPMVDTVGPADEQQAVQAAADLGGRVVLKAEAEGLVHKSDAGAVKLNLSTPREVTEAYRDLVDRFGSRLRQVLVQPMLAGGIETLVGVRPGTGLRPAHRARARRRGHQRPGRSRSAADPAEPGRRG
jgi:acyl-CoA synthetase (NDP forming)